MSFENEYDENDYFCCDYIQVEQPIGCFYVVSMKFLDVIKIAKADVRKLNSGVDNYLGIQRKLSSDRKKEIALYATTFDATFPTSVILAVKSVNENGEFNKNIFVDEQKRKLMIKKQEGVASILDGQHRLEGLKQANDDFGVDDFDLNVTIFVDADIETQTQIFSVINKSQTKVNKSLVYDLYEYATHRSPYKTAHDIVRVLNKNEKSPFYHKIKLLGVANDKEKESISQATFAERILGYISKDPVDDRNRLKKDERIESYDPQKFIFRNFFIKKRDDEITKILYYFFDAVKNKWSDSWEKVVSGNILNKTTGVIALMRFLPDLCAKAKSEEQLLTKEFYLNIIDEFNIEDGSFTSDEYRSGGQGQDKLYHVLSEELELVCGNQKELTDDQFERAFKSAGGWFIVSHYKLIADSSRDQSELLDFLFAQGFDKDKRGTKTRLSAVKRIIEGRRVRETMEKIRDSEKINNEHPNAKAMAEEILATL